MLRRSISRRAQHGMSCGPSRAAYFAGSRTRAHSRVSHKAAIASRSKATNSNLPGSLAMSLDFEAKRQWLQSTPSWHQGRRRRFFDDGWSVDATGKITAAIYRYCRIAQRNTSVMSRPRSLNRQRAGQRLRKGLAASAEFDDLDGCVGAETKPALVFAPDCKLLPTW